MDYNEYFDDVWAEIPASIVSEEYMSRNRELIESLTYDFYRADSMQGEFDVYKTATLLRNIFVSIQKIGIR